MGDDENEIIMQKLKTGYVYLFYFLYNSINRKGNILVQPKTLFVIGALEMFVFYSIIFYYTAITKSRLDAFFKYSSYLLIFSNVVFNLWFFDRKANWKKYLEEFSKWPETKQKKWNWVMRLIIFFIIGNLVYSIIVFTQIDCKRYS